jgi:hypothetical protein
MAALGTDIATYIVNNGEAVAIGADIFIDFQPEDPADCIAVYVSNAGSPHTFEDTITRSIQVVSRSANPSIALDNATNIMMLFRQDDEKFQLVDTRWAVSHIIQVPFKLKIDNKRRVSYAFNMNITTILD